LITIFTSLSFDNWVLLKDQQVVYYTWGVNMMILILIVGYVGLQSTKNS